MSVQAERVPDFVQAGFFDPIFRFGFLTKCTHRADLHAGMLDSRFDASYIVDLLYHKLTTSGIDVLLDDRDARPGFKFADADLIGIPVRINIGDRGNVTANATGGTATGGNGGVGGVGAGGDGGNATNLGSSASGTPLRSSR